MAKKQGARDFRLGGPGGEPPLGSVSGVGSAPFPPSAPPRPPRRGSFAKSSPFPKLCFIHRNPELELELEQGSKQSVGTSKRQTGRLKEERKSISGQGPENKVLGGVFHFHPEPTVLSQRQQGSWFQVWGSLGLRGWRSFSPSACRRALLIRVFIQTTRGPPPPSPERCVFAAWTAGKLGGPKDVCISIQKSGRF